MFQKFIVIWFISLLLGCGSSAEIRTVQISLNQPLEAFESDDILALWVYEESKRNCDSLNAEPETTTESETGFLSQDVEKVQKLESGARNAHFEIGDLPADTALSFLAKISQSASGEVLTHGCNRSDAIGKGNLLDLQILLPRPE